MKLLALTRAIIGYTISFHLAMLRFAVARQNKRLENAKMGAATADMACKAARQQADVAKAEVAKARAQRSSMVRAANIEAASFGREVAVYA